MHDQREIHLQAAYRVLHYLKAHLGKGILFKKTLDIALAIYTDAEGVHWTGGQLQVIVHFLGEI